jgi:tetraacyldisaccharide 4'-kinase
MLDENRLQAIWYGERRPGLVLRLLSGVFGVLGAVRRGLYASGLRPRICLPVPVLVVGNLTVGGTGKTPLVIALVEALAARGWRPGVVARGYAGRARGVERVTAASDPLVVGDEPVLIHEVTGAPVAVGRDRVAAARLLLGEIDLLIADDGLQHLRLGRDAAIVVIDGVRRFGNGRLLPAGPLREPPNRSARADWQVVNGGVPRVGETAMTLRGDEAWALAEQRARRALAEFAGARVHAVAGIGHPQRFFAQLRAAGIEPIEHSFPDHYVYTPRDLEFGDSLPVLMTHKDAVKCRAFAAARWWYVPVRAELPTQFFDGVAARLEQVAAEKN